jgi:hypothetical protein
MALPNQPINPGFPEGTQIRGQSDRFQQVCLALPVRTKEENPVALEG